MADPTPAERERSILGGRLLGTQPVIDSVKSMGQEFTKFTRTLGEVRKAVEDQKRQITGGNRAGGGGPSWNAGSHWGGWGSQNGGGFRINGAASHLGLRNAGLTGLGTVGMPGSGTSFTPAGQMVAGSRTQAFGGSNGGVGAMPFGRSAIAATMGRMAVAGGLGALTSWADRNTASMDQRDLLATRAYNNGGYSSIMAAQRRLATGNATGYGVADQVSAQMMGQMNGGINGGLGRNRGSLLYGGMLDPTQSNVTGMQIQQNLTAAPRVNQLQMFGISALQGGNQRGSANINDQILTRLGAAGPMTVKQRMATFRDQNSRLNQTMRSWGFDADMMQSVQNQGAAQARIQQQGGDVGRFRSLLTQAGGTGKGSRGARDTLRDEFDFKFSNVDERKQWAATNEDRNADTLKGFRDGVRQSTEALSGFSDAVRKIMAATGTAGVVGQWGGALGQMGSGVGVGATVGGALGAGAHMLGGMLAWRGAKRLMRGGGGAGAARVAGMGASLGGAAIGAAAAAGAGLAVAGARGISGANSAHGQRMQARIQADSPGGALSGFNAWMKTSLHKGLGSMPVIGGSVRGSLDTDQYEDDEGRGAGEEVSAQSVVSKAAQYARGGTNFGVGKCQTFVRSCYGSPGGAASAAAAWSAAKYKHPGDANPPAGASVFWVGGSKGYGHVAVSAGGGSIYSTDVKAPGKVHLTTISWINQHWGNQRYVGWSEDNNGIRCKVGGSVAIGAAGDSAPGGANTGTTGSAAGTTASSGIMGAYGSVNEADAVSGALAGFAGATVGGSSGAMNAEGSTDGPGVTAGGGRMAGGVRGIVQKMAAQRGWTGAQWSALEQLVTKESGWNPKADNPSSSAAGLFQKMTSIHGPLEQTVEGQAKWGLNYIEGRYGNPVKAWDFWQKNNHYAKGAFEIEDDQTARVHKGEMIIPRAQAETIRQALLRENVGHNGGGGGRGVEIHFESGSIVFKGNVGKDADARKFAKQIVTMITEDDRLVEMGDGR